MRPLPLINFYNLVTDKAYRMRLTMQEIYQYPCEIAPMVLQDWIQWGLRCRLKPINGRSCKNDKTQYNGSNR